MRWMIAVFALVLTVAGCQGGAAPQGLSLDQYVRALRDRQMHDIRVEPNKKLAASYKAAAAADVYVAGQHVIVIQGTPETDAQLYAGLLQGYAAQKWIVRYNKNLVLVAEPNTQQTMLEAFEGLR